MTVSVKELEENLEELIQTLIDGKEKEIIISKNGKPVIQMTSLVKMNNKRIGAAKKEMEGFDMSLEDFNAISVDDFD